MNPTNLVQPPTPQTPPMPMPAGTPQQQPPVPPAQGIPAQPVQQQPMQQPVQPIQPTPIQPQIPTGQPQPGQPQPGQPGQPGKTLRYKVQGSKADLKSPGSIVFNCLTETAVEKYSIWDPNMPNPNSGVRGFFRREGDVIPGSNGMSYPVSQTKMFDNKTFKQLFGDMRKNIVYERKISIQNQEYLCDFPKSVEFGPRGHSNNITGGIQGLFNIARSQSKNPLQLSIQLNKQGTGLGTQYMVMEAGAPQQLAQPVGNIPQQSPVQPAMPIQTPQQPMAAQPQPIGQSPQAVPQQPAVPNSYAGVNLQQPAQPQLDERETEIVQKYTAAGFRGIDKKDVIVKTLTENKDATQQFITPDRATWIFENFMK